MTDTMVLFGLIVPVVALIGSCGLIKSLLEPAPRNDAEDKGPLRPANPVQGPRRVGHNGKHVPAFNPDLQNLEPVRTNLKKSNSAKAITNVKAKVDTESQRPFAYDDWDIIERAKPPNKVSRPVKSLGIEGNVPVQMGLPLRF